MKHLGDIRNIKGNEIPKVDVITGGSPCQDLSVAGKREGLKGERSGLFLEQIRIITCTCHTFTRDSLVKIIGDGTSPARPHVRCSVSK